MSLDEQPQRSREPCQQRHKIGRWRGFPPSIPQQTETIFHHSGIDSKKQGRHERVLEQSQDGFFGLFEKVRCSEKHQRERVDGEVDLEIEKKALVEVDAGTLVTGEARVHEVSAGDELRMWMAKIYLVHVCVSVCVCVTMYTLNQEHMKGRSVHLEFIEKY